MEWASRPEAPATPYFRSAMEHAPLADVLGVPGDGVRRIGKIDLAWRPTGWGRAVRFADAAGPRRPSIRVREAAWNLADRCEGGGHEHECGICGPRRNGATGVGCAGPAGWRRRRGSSAGRPAGRDAVRRPGSSSRTIHREADDR